MGPHIPRRAWLGWLQPAKIRRSEFPECARLAFRYISQRAARYFEAIAGRRDKRCKLRYGARTREYLGRLRGRPGRQRRPGYRVGLHLRQGRAQGQLQNHRRLDRRRRGAFGPVVDDFEADLEPGLVVDGARRGIQAAVGDQAGRAADPDIHAYAHRIAACIACRGDRQWLRSIERLAGRCIGSRAEHTPEIHYAVFLQAVANQAKPDEEYEGPSALLNFDSHNLPQAFLSASRAPMVFCAASGAASGGTMPISTLNCLTNSLARSFSTSSSILIAC